MGMRQRRKERNEIRRARTHTDEKTRWEINLRWKASAQEEYNLIVYAAGTALVVTGFQTFTGEKITFLEAGSNKDFNYNGEDGGALSYGAVTGTLAKLRDGRYKTLPNDEKRNAYVMCVFMASEIVRNEVLEGLLLKGLQGWHVGKWHDYYLLYQNWSSVSGALYNTKGQRAEVIRVDRVCKALNDGTMSELTMNSELMKAYRNAIAIIQS